MYTTITLLDSLLSQTACTVLRISEFMFLPKAVILFSVYMTIETGCSRSFPLVFLFGLDLLLASERSGHFASFVWRSNERCNITDDFLQFHREYLTSTTNQIAIILPAMRFYLKRNMKFCLL